MPPILALLAAAIGVFVASSLVHMVLKWHAAEYRQLPNEEAVAAALRAGNLAPGQYVLPYCPDHRLLKEEAMQRKFREGPVAILTMRAPGAPSMGRPLALWFVLNAIVAAAAGTLAYHVYGAGDPMRAGCLGATFTFFAYATGSWQAGVWMGKPFRAVVFDTLDAAIYAGVTLLAFRFLWS